MCILRLVMLSHSKYCVGCGSVGDGGGGGVAADVLISIEHIC